MNLLRLAQMTNRDELRESAERTLAAFEQTAVAGAARHCRRCWRRANFC